MTDATAPGGDPRTAAPDASDPPVTSRGTSGSASGDATSVTPVTGDIAELSNVSGKNLHGSVLVRC